MLENQNLNMRYGETGKYQREDLKDTLNRKPQMNQQWDATVDGNQGTKIL